MKSFINDLATKMAIALEVPMDIDKDFTKDKELRLCINVYGTKMLEPRREKTLLLTFLALMYCPNTYKTTLLKIQELASRWEYKSVKPKKESSIETYRSKIVNECLTFEKSDLPECAFIWKEKIMKELMR